MSLGVRINNQAEKGKKKNSDQKRYFTTYYSKRIQNHSAIDTLNKQSDLNIILYRI